LKEQAKLKNMQVGDSLDHFLLLAKIEVKTARNGREYLNLELRDETQLLSGKIWDGYTDLLNEAKAGSIVKVIGQIEEYQGQQQIKIGKIRTSDQSDNVNIDLFMPKSLRDLKEMRKELKDVVDSIQHTFLSALIHKIFSKDAYHLYERVPAGKSWHHAYIHGLLEHTLEIVKLCELTASFHQEVNRDLLITGALLHDFGKTQELGLDANFEYTDKGKFLGHIVIAAGIIEKAADSIPNFPEDIKQQLIHLVLSHQGKLEFASPVEPKTLEAIILYHCDELSAKANAYKQAINADDNGENRWTRYLPLAGTSLYIPPKKDDIKENLFDL
jgi:3'-5' exoribonuclease